MRHRQRVVTAALACALPLVAGCGDQPSDAPATGGADGSFAVGADGTAAGTSIPDDFPLSSGMGAPTDTVATSRTGTGLRDLELCGTSPLRGLGTRDRMVADNSGGESADTRELLVLGAPGDARRLAERLKALASDCTEPDARPDLQTRTEVLPSPFGPGPASTLLQTYTVDGEPGTGATVVHVVPVGAAVLVTSTYGQWTREGALEAVEATVGPLRGTVEALAAFGDVAQPGASPTRPAEPAQDPAEVPAEVPADFPLDAGLRDGGGDDVATPPTDEVAMDPVEMCGRRVWPTAETTGTRHLYSSLVGPEQYDGRELVVHPDADAAVRAMTEVRRAASECRHSGHQVWTDLSRDTGYDTVTMGLTYDDGLGSSVYQVTRVGSARLMVQTYGEGTLTSLDRQADEVTATTDQIVQAMCVFTKTGC